MATVVRFQTCGFPYSTEPHITGVSRVCVRGCHSLSIIWPVHHEWYSKADTSVAEWSHGNGTRKPSVCQLLFEHLNIRALHTDRNRRYWVKPWTSRRDQLGKHDTLTRELREEDPEAFINYLSLTIDMYAEVLLRITFRITKQDTWCRQDLDPGQKFT